MEVFVKNIHSNPSWGREYVDKLQAKGYNNKDGSVVTWLIFYGKILRNTSYFARFRTSQVRALTKYLFFLHFSRKNTEK